MASKKNPQNVSFTRFIENYLNNKFKVWFRVDQQFIDLRDMSKNYKDGAIPLEDINQLHQLVTGIQVDEHPYDPENDGVVQFAWVSWADLYLNPIFQRDSSPYQIKKINNDFEHTAVIVPCAIMIDGKYYVWDGHHTLHNLRFKHYTKFPIWYINGDKIKEEDAQSLGFATKADYLIWLAGKNMKRINLLNKMKLSHYDAYKISVDIQDPDYVAMDRILHHAGFEVKRQARNNSKSSFLPFTQPNSGFDIYKIKDSHERLGTYLRQSLEFHKQTWPNSAAILEIWRPVARICETADTEGVALDKQFFTELGNLLKSRYGDPETAQEKLKLSLEQAIKNKSYIGIPADHDQWKVHDALINLYVKKINRIQLPGARCRWEV